jgi:Fe-S-cluster containining protein
MAAAQTPRVQHLDRDKAFAFRCGPDLACFTECCRQLDLALTPYDVQRLRHALGLGWAEFLDRYAVVEANGESAFPQVYLSMVDDGRASCPFVNPEGCSVYADRPGACRTYPLGRGSRLGPDGRVDDFYVLVTEPHCRGFAESRTQTGREWLDDQELALYNEFNDLTMAVLQHPAVRAGFRPDARQRARFLELLYDPGRLRNARAPAGLDDELLLRRAHELLLEELFPG